MSMEPANAPGREVALFVTCLTDQYQPHVAVAATQVLEKLGWRVRFPAAQTCCGQPFFNNGYWDEARALARRMVEIFEPYEYIVTPSASCCAMVREQFPRLLAGDHAWESACRKVVAGTWEFVEFLQKVARVEVSKLAVRGRQKVTYHYNCHLRALGEGADAAAMLRKLGNVEFAPLEKAEQCCGFGGTFAVKYPAISAALAEDKVDCIGRSGAESVICNDAGCAMNIAGMAHRAGAAVRVRHIAELLAEALDAGETPW